MNKVIFKANINSLNEALDFIDSELEAANCSSKALTQINIAFEEIFVNIAHYAYSGSEGDVEVGINISNNVVEIVFIDSGIAFNPLENEDPDINLPVQDRNIGGLGIFIVKNTMDSVKYENKDGNNIFKMVKSF